MNARQCEIQQMMLDFAVRIIKLKKYLNTEKHEFNIADQIQRSSSSIGAMYSEAVYAESKTDYIHKLCIAQKETNETVYWIKLLFQAEFISQEQYDSLMVDVTEIMRVLTGIILALKKNT